MTESRWQSARSTPPRFRPTSRRTGMCSASAACSQRSSSAWSSSSAPTAAGSAWRRGSRWRVDMGVPEEKSDRELLRRYHQGGDVEARERLIEQYLPLVRSLARRYSYRGEQLEDLVQVGCIGLIKAIDRFDLDRGVELTTY